MDKLRVLLVDDEIDFLETSAKRLRKRGLNVLSAPGGIEALKVLADVAVDVVVLDVKMPGMDGMQTLREIKKLQPSAEVIMLTGHANLEAAMLGMELGAFDYLMKPTDADELLYKIQDAYKQKLCREECERGSVGPREE